MIVYSLKNRCEISLLLSTQEVRALRATQGREGPPTQPRQLSQLELFRRWEKRKHSRSIILTTSATHDQQSHAAINHRYHQESTSEHIFAWNPTRPLVQQSREYQHFRALPEDRSHTLFLRCIEENHQYRRETAPVSLGSQGTGIELTPR